MNKNKALIITRTSLHVCTRWGIITGPPWFILYSLWTSRQKLIIKKLAEMSGRLCCCKQQQHSKLLAQFVSAFRFNTRTKTRAPLIAVSITRWSSSSQTVRCANAVRRRPWSALCRPLALLTTLCNPADLKSSCLVAKAWVEWSLESPLSTDQLSHEPYGRDHCLIETRKTLDSWRISGRSFSIRRTSR